MWYNCIIRGGAMEKRFENFTVSIIKLYRLVQRIKIHEMRDYGLKSVHVMCIYYLYEYKQGLTAGDLISLMYEDKAAISRALALLRDKNYILYDASKYNALITLTEEGEKVARYINEKADCAVAAGSADLSESERKLCYRFLDEITKNLQNYYNKLKEIK